MNTNRTETDAPRDGVEDFAREIYEARQQARTEANGVTEATWWGANESVREHWRNVARRLASLSQPADTGVGVDVTQDGVTVAVRTGGTLMHCQTYPTPRAAAASQSAVWFIDANGQRWQVSGPETDEFRAIVRELSAVARHGGEGVPFAHAMFDRNGSLVDFSRYTENGQYVFTVGDFYARDRTHPHGAPHCGKLLYDHAAKPTPPVAVDEAMRKALTMFRAAKEWVASDSWDGIDQRGRELMEEADVAATAALAAAGMGQPTKRVCDGCPNLKTEWWKDYLDNDETDSGTSATCMHSIPGKSITAYWRKGDASPGWCPLAATAQPPAAGVPASGMLALEKLSGAAGLMLAEIDTCGHEVDPAYRTTLYEAWEEAKVMLAAAPQPEAKADCDECKGAGYTVTPGGVSDTCPNGCQPKPAEDSALQTIIATLQADLKWNEECHRRDGEEVNDDMHVRPREFMTRGTLKAWIDALRSASTPADVDEVALIAARQFTRDDDPQGLARMQCRIIAAIKGEAPKPADGGAVVAWQAVYPDGKLFGSPVKDAPPYFVEWNAAEGHPVRPLVFGDFAPAGSGEAVAGSGEVKGWATHHDEPMLFPTRDEAVAYCDDDEEPIPLYAGAAPAVDAEALHTLIAEWRDPEGWTDATRYLSLNEWKFGRPARKQCADELESIITGADHGR
jgi:hypothetical protein